MARPWEGFWQVLYDDVDEDIVPFRDTTTALRTAQGFSIYTRTHFMEIRVDGMRHPPAAWPPTRSEAIAMLRAFFACAGPCAWREVVDGWRGDQAIIMASDPRIEGNAIHCSLEMEGDRGRCQRVLPDGTQVSETWRRLSGAGASPLAGAWESGGPDDLWMYLVTAGHYGVIRTTSARPKAPSQGEEFSDAEAYALWEGFGANAGARLETAETFDHWPMIGQVAGYEVRKHETFRIDLVEDDRFIATLSPDEEPDEGWRRLD